MSLEQISQKLKSAREGQGLSVRQIYERTKIPVGHLQSIENGVFDELPEPVYVAGFIKRYADCVGLSGQSLAEEYRRLAEESGGNGKNGWAKHSIQQPVYVSADLGRIKVDRDPPTFKTIYFNAIWIVVVLGLISYLTYTQLNNQSTQQDPSVLALKEATSRYNGAQNPSAAGTQTTMSTQQTSAGDARVVLSASQHVWTEVKSVSNGASLFTGYLEQGDRRDFQDSQGLRVRVGNGGSLTVDFQGRIETFGEPGKVAERTFMSSSQSTASSEPPKDATTSATAASRPAATAPRRTAAQSSDAGARRSRYRSIDGVQSRQYLPGESLGGTRSIDVPYRYSEGRLDAD